MGTHPIFESDFDCLTECLSRLAARSVRRYTRPTDYNNPTRAFKKVYGLTAAHGPEVYALTVYCLGCLSYCVYNLCYAGFYKKNEMSALPYINKDMNYMYNQRISWTDPSAQRTLCFSHGGDTKFFDDSAWKNDLKSLLDEIHED